MSIRVYDLKAKRESKPDFQLVCGEGYNLGMALSPDGQQLAFVVSCDNEWSIQISPSSGGATREVLRLRKERGTWDGRELAWTPDGRYLLFLGKDAALGVDDSHKVPELWLWRVSVEGGEPQNLGLTIRHESHLSFHPDGRRIAFTGPDTRHGGEIWAIENFLPGFAADK